MTLKAFREDGTEVRPGDPITMAGAGDDFTFRAATSASNDCGINGMIEVDGYGGLYSAPFGLTVRAVPVADDEPEWHNAGTGDPGTIRRDIRGPGGFYAVVVQSGSWLVIDSSDGETVTSGIAYGQDAGKQAVTDWEREHGLIHDAWLASALSPQERSQDEPSSSDRSEPPASLNAMLSVVDHNRAELLTAQQDQPEDGASSERDAYLGALENLADAVHDYLSENPGRAAALAAEADRAARRMGPPVPGVTTNTGHTVYAVLPSGRAGRWWVAMENERERVTWDAEACEDGTLAYNTGHYHAGGEGSEAEALTDLADRAGVFRMLTDLSSGVAAREAFRESHAKVLDELSGTWGVGRARVRAGLLEAAALGYARISWHDHSTRRDYGIRYDRMRCTFSWNQEH